MTGGKVISLPDHGGGISRAVQVFGGPRSHWLDLSTGVNSNAYNQGGNFRESLRALPDFDAQSALEEAARRFWKVPDGAAVLAAPGASSLIARMPAVAGQPPKSVQIPAPTYNEHARAFAAAGWDVGDDQGGSIAVRVLVNPNNPDGRHWTAGHVDGADLAVIDESFCDVTPEVSLIHLAATPGRIVLKSFGKFWGLAGLRLGFAIGDPDLIGGLARLLGPWPVSGPALAIGTQALNDPNWAAATRVALARDAARLDALATGAGLETVGGTDLFRLYKTPDAQGFFDRLARQHILTRIFPYSKEWVRIGLPGGDDDWSRLEAAL